MAANFCEVTIENSALDEILVSFDQSNNETVVSTLYNQQAETDKLPDLLLNWGLSHLYETLIRYNLTPEAFKYITNDNLDTIFIPPSQLFDKIIFKGKLNEWRQQHNHAILGDPLPAPAGPQAATTASRVASWVENAQAYQSEGSRNNDPFLPDSI